MSAPERGQPVVVTGSTGFVGKHLCATLAAAGIPVRALVRRGAASSSAVHGIEHVTVRDEAWESPEDLARILDGAEAVIHLAARVHVMDERDADPLSAFRRTNVALTRRLAEAASLARVPTFVFASSVKVMGEGAGNRFTESTEPRPSDPYGISKLEAEAALGEVAASSQLRVASLRFPLVYGAGVRANMLALIRAVDRGLPLPLGGIDNRRSLLFTGNLIEAVRAVLAKPPPRAQAYFVSDDEDVSTSELIHRIAKALGKPARLLPFPSTLLRGAARIGDRLPSWTRFPLRSAVIDRLTGSLSVDCGLLRRESGYVPRYSLDEGLRETVRWYQSTKTGAAA